MADGIGIIETVKTTQHRGVIPAVELRRMLGLPDGARIHVEVPGGGDWSSRDLVIGSDVELQVSWETVETS